MQVSPLPQISFVIIIDNKYNINNHPPTTWTMKQFDAPLTMTNVYSK